MSEQNKDIFHELFSLLIRRDLGYHTEKNIFKRVKYAPHEMVDWLKANPDATRKEVIEHSKNLYQQAREKYPQLPEEKEHSTPFGAATTWIPKLEQCSTPEKFAHNVIDAVYETVEEHYPHLLQEYPAVLHRNGLPLSGYSMKDVDLSALDSEGMFAFFISIVCGNRFCEGIVDIFFSNGCALHWLKSLAELDTPQSPQ